MKWRWIAGMVCALYLSVGTVFSAAHDHSDDALHGKQQCAACAWHHESADVPVVEPGLRAPEPISHPQATVSFFVSDFSLGIHPTRGPPHFSP